MKLIHTCMHLYSKSTTHFLSRKTKLKKRKTIVMMIPQVARMRDITVTAKCTVIVSFLGIPSYGIPSTTDMKMRTSQYVIASFQSHSKRPGNDSKWIKGNQQPFSCSWHKWRKRDKEEEGEIEQLKLWHSFLSASHKKERAGILRLLTSEQDREKERWLRNTSSY